MTNSKFPSVELISNDIAPLAEDELAAASGGTSKPGGAGDGEASLPRPLTR